MKSILHFQIPVGTRGIQDDILIRPETIGKFLKLVKDKIGDDYLVITSPCTPSLLDYKGETLYNFDMKQISIEELLLLLEKDINKI